MGERDELPPINFDKLQKQPDTHIKPEVETLTSFVPSKTWTYLAGPFMKAFIIIQALAILIKLVMSFSSFYIVITYPGLLFSLILLITQIQLHRGALVALQDPTQNEGNFKLMRRLYWLYVVNFVLGIVTLIITTNLMLEQEALNATDPLVTTYFKGAIFFIIFIAIVLGVLIIALINRYLTSIILTVSEATKYPKSGSILLMILCYFSAFSNFIELFSSQTENSARLVNFAHSIGLEYVPINTAVQNLIYLCSLVLAVMMARIIRLSREFNS